MRVGRQGGLHGTTFETMQSAITLTDIPQDRKNALEEYVYEMRGKLDDRYATYVQSSEKEQLLSGLSAAEDWLYTEEGEDATKSQYVEKLDSLKKLGDPIVLRWRESEQRPKAAASLRESLSLFLSQAQSGDAKYEHIPEEDLNKVVSYIHLNLRF